MNQEILAKRARIKTLWTEIKAKEQEYSRICEQIRKMEQLKSDVSFAIQKKVQECDRISDWLLEKEYQALSKENM